MKTRPDGLSDAVLAAALADGWGLDAVGVEYVPVGFGSHHWAVTDASGRRWFATVDDLAGKPWLGETRSARLHGLRAAFDSAAALRDAGLGFVVAPVRTPRGETVRALDARYALAVFPFVDGRAGSFGDERSSAERAAVVALLAELHAATPMVEAGARRDRLEVAGRRDLESALRAVGTPWAGGPFSEPARQALSAASDEVVALLVAVDELARRTAARAKRSVVTHGEPHAGNLMRADGLGLLLVDWDTVALAPPERDLWLVLGATGDGAAAYTEATGHRVDEDALDFYRCAWDAADLAAFVRDLRAPHREDEDAVATLGYLTGILDRLGRA